MTGLCDRCGHLRKIKLIDGKWLCKECKKRGDEMNLHEFNKLKTGDVVQNAMTNGEGTVTNVAVGRTDRVVKVKWGDGAGSVEFSYPTHSTAWMHWSAPTEGTGGQPAGCAACSVTNIALDSV